VEARQVVKLRLGVLDARGAILLAGGAGFWADRYFGTAPWCLLTGLIAGLGIGFYQLARVLRR